MWGFELSTSKMNHVVCGSEDLKLWYHRFLHGNVLAYGISTEAPPCAVHHLEPAAKGKQMVRTTWQMGDIMIHHPAKRDALTHGRSWGSKFNHAMEQPKECCLVSLLTEGMEDYIRTTTYCILFSSDQWWSMHLPETNISKIRRVSQLGLEDSSGRCPMGVEVSAINCVLLRRVRLWWPTSP